MSLLDRPDAIAEEVVPRSRIDALLQCGERLLDESRRLLDELNAIDDGTAARRVTRSGDRNGSDLTRSGSENGRNER